MMSPTLKPSIPLSLLAAALAGLGLLHLGTGPAATDAEAVRRLQSTRLTEQARHRLAMGQTYLAAEAEDPAIAPALGSDAVEARLDTMLPAAGRFGLSALAVHDQASNSLRLARAPSRPGEFYGFEAVAKAAYAQGRALVQAGHFRGAPALLFAQPVHRDGAVQGLLLGAKPVDQALAEGLSADLGLPVGLSLDGQRFGADGAISAPLGLDGGPALILSAQRPPQPEASGPRWPYALLALLLAGGGLGLGLSALRAQARREQALTDAAAGLAEPVRRDAALTALAAATGTDSLGQIAGTVHQAFEAVQAETQGQAQRCAGLEAECKQLRAEAQALAKARDEALRAPRTKSEFLSRMGDEITTPMHSVTSMLDLLREYDLPSEPKELLNIASRSAHTLVENLNNILDFSKLDAHMLKLVKEQFAVAPLVEQVVNQLRPHAKDKGLRLESNIAEGVPETVYNDPHRIQQILANLVGNAIRFTREGEVAVYIDVLQPAQERFLRFSVVDTGMGIPKDAQAGLFESLDQRSKLTNSSFAGRLRLIVAKEMAALMGGQIGVSSEPGKGSRFWFTVRLEG